MSRTPEETARLAATVVLAYCAADLAEALAEVARLRADASCLTADVVAASGYVPGDGEGEALVAWHRVLDRLRALRADAGLLAEWREARQAELAAKALTHDTTRLEESLNDDCRRETDARKAREAIEDRMLAAVLPEEVER